MKMDYKGYRTEKGVGVIMPGMSPGKVAEAQEQYERCWALYESANMQDFLNDLYGWIEATDLLKGDVSQQGLEIKNNLLRASYNLKTVIESMGDLKNRVS